MKTEFIAEVSSNHNQNLDRCLQFVDTAADIGCTAVKFQLFKLEELFSPEVLKTRPGHRKRKEWELPLSFLPTISQRCRAKNIGFGCTPFYLDAVEELQPHVDFLKISSYELLWTDLLVACARSGKRVILSTGMADMSEVTQAVKTLQKAGCKDLTLLHCVSAYPTPAKACNLSTLALMSKKFGCPVGWSDHSVQPAVLHRAIHRWGASVIEFHLDLDGYGVEAQAGHCWLPGPIKHVIETTALAFSADGKPEKAPATEELSDRDWRADPVDGLRPLQTIRGKLI